MKGKEEKILSELELLEKKIDAMALEMQHLREENATLRKRYSPENVGLLVRVALERQESMANARRGLAEYKANGGKLGRPVKDIDWEKVREYEEMGIPTTRICKLLHVSPKTFYKRLGERRL